MITPKDGSYSINKVSGSIIVTDKPAVLDKIGDLVSTINESLSRQQSFEIQIIEVTLSSDHETGIDWNAIAKGIKGTQQYHGIDKFYCSGIFKRAVVEFIGHRPGFDQRDDQWRSVNGA